MKSPIALSVKIMICSQHLRIVLSAEILLKGESHEKTSIIVCRIPFSPPHDVIPCEGGIPAGNSG